MENRYILKLKKNRKIFNFSSLGLKFVGKLLLENKSSIKKRNYSILLNAISEEAIHIKPFWCSQTKTKEKMWKTILQFIPECTDFLLCLKQLLLDFVMRKKSIYIDVSMFETKETQTSNALNVYIQVIIIWCYKGFTGFGTDHSLDSEADFHSNRIH